MDCRDSRMSLGCRPQARDMYDLEKSIDQSDTDPLCKDPRSRNGHHDA